jgi:cyclohexyl-isocyanide hydratase
MSERENRRQFLQTGGLAGLAGMMLAQGGSAAGQSLGSPTGPASPTAAGVLGAASAGPGRPRIAMLVHPKMIMQDLIGPLTVLNIMRAEIHLVWKTREPVMTETGLTVAPSTVFADCPEQLDVLFAPGGLEGTIACIEDSEVVAFMASRGAKARYITSDCTGSLLLGAAGLLKGYRAASNWTVVDQLAYYGATPVHDRVVHDRNRLTGGGVTAGIDFGLKLVELLRGRELAETIQLTIEYAPEPPFNSGSPKTAPKAIVDAVRQRRSPAVEKARAIGRAWQAAAR